MLSRNSDKEHLVPLHIAPQQQQCCQPAGGVSCSPADASPPGSRILCDSQSQVERTQSELLIAFATMTSGLDSVKSRIPVSFSLQSCLVLFTQPTSPSHPRRKWAKGWNEAFCCSSATAGSHLQLFKLSVTFFGKKKKTLNAFISILAWVITIFGGGLPFWQSPPPNENERQKTMNDGQGGVTTRVMSFTHGTSLSLWEMTRYYEHASQERPNNCKEVVAVNRIFVCENPFLLHAIGSYVVQVIKFFITVLPSSKRVQYNNRMKMCPILRRGLGLAHISEAPRFSFFLSETHLALWLKKWSK